MTQRPFWKDCLQASFSMVVGIWIWEMQIRPFIFDGCLDLFHYLWRW